MPRVPAASLPLRMLIDEPGRKAWLSISTIGCGTHRKGWLYLPGTVAASTAVSSSHSRQHKSNKCEKYTAALREPERVGMSTKNQIVVRRNGVMTIGSDVPEAEARLAILRKILDGIRITATGCWEWTGFCHPEWKYGETGYRGRVWRIHRLIWTIMKGEIEEGIVVRHKCDNPPCCNPEHLVLGTDADNVEDRMRRGRDHHSQLTECPQGHPYAGDNLYVDPRGFRHCRTCGREKNRDPEYIAKRREYQRQARIRRRLAAGLQVRRTAERPHGPSR